MTADPEASGALADLRLEDGMPDPRSVPAIPPAEARDRGPVEPDDAGRALPELLATVLHELRTPLASLVVTADLLVSNFDRVTPNEAVGLLHRMQRNASWLQALVENLTVEAQLELAQLQLQCTVLDLADSIEMALAIAQPSLDRTGQRVVVESVGHAPVWADPRRVEQVLVNLLNNAAKYGPPDADIRIGVNRDREWVRITVQDRGPGVPVAERARIFERYARGSTAHASGTGGLGLGLHIVKTLVERHGGMVGVDGEPGQGACFWFTLPALAAPDEE
jgi:signal transduction histidine kinase